MFDVAVPAIQDVLAARGVASRADDHRTESSIGRSKPSAMFDRFAWPGTERGNHSMETEPTQETEGPHPRRLLVAMLHTMAGPTVFDHLYQLAQEQSTEFHLMMPVLRPDYGLTWTDAQASQDADDRLVIMLEFMARAGLSATGETRTEDPPEALDLVARGPSGPFDGVLVVWRQKKHRWLFKRKSEGFEEALGIPVEAIRADPPIRHSNIEDPGQLREIFEEHAASQGWGVQ
ncbi:MAG: hypothetical protein WD638_10375 [Nitriliruptoraceae bacterium]